MLCHLEWPDIDEASGLSLVQIVSESGGGWQGGGGAEVAGGKLLPNDELLPNSQFELSER